MTTTNNVWQSAPSLPPGAGLWIKRLILVTAIGSWQVASFADLYAPGACTLIPSSQACVDATPCKTAPTGENVCLAGVPAGTGGFNVPKTCWQYKYQYACAGDVLDTCTPYENNPACGVISSTCQNYQQPSNQCDSWSLTYKCQTAPAQTGTQLQCTNGLFDTSLFPTPTNTNNTFVRAAIAQEMLRQSQIYSQNGANIFAGEKESCTKGYGGIKNCCNSAPGAKNNSQMAGITLGAAGSVTKYYGSQAVDWASSYMFDAMYNNGIWTEAMTSLFENGTETFGTSIAAADFSVGAYGVSYTTATYAAETTSTGGGLFGSDTVLLNLGDNGALLFNPYVFAIAVVIVVVTSLASCSKDEQMLAMHKGASLSVYEGEVCSSKILGVCVEYTDAFCSFNSVLAKIVNTAGKHQLGLDPTDCGGFTVDQLKSIDFSRIDFSEFAASVADQATRNLPTSAGIQQNYTTLLGNATGGSAQAGAMIPGSSIVGGVAAPTAPPPNANLPSYPPNQP